MKDKLRILFMGSPEFAAQSLEQLITNGFNVVGVITGPDRKKGRGQALHESEVKQCAKRFTIPVLQPKNLKDETFIDELTSLKPDLGVVVAFRMLPEKVWNLPKLGTINLHASLLPDYRGAAPINWAIINGEEKTGLTTFFLKHEIDTGDVILRKEVPITYEMNAGELHDTLMIEGSKLLCKTVELIEKGSYDIIIQETLLKGVDILHKAPKIYKSDCRIDWTKNAQDIYNFIRGMSPYPGAWSTFLTLTGKEVIFKVYSSEITDESSDKRIGQIRIVDNNKLTIGTGDYFLQIIVVQIEGKKKMMASEFLKGFLIKDVTVKL